MHLVAGGIIPHFISALGWYESMTAQRWKGDFYPQNHNQRSTGKPSVGWFGFSKESGAAVPQPSAGLQICLCRWSNRVLAALRGSWASWESVPQTAGDGCR